MSVAVAVAVAVVVPEVTVPVKGDFICKTCAKKLKPKQAQLLSISEMGHF